MFNVDIPRPFAARRHRIRPTLYLLTIIIFIAAVSAGLSRLEPAAPQVDRSTLWMGEVKRGDLTRRVRGLGKLIPEVIRWIPGVLQQVEVEVGQQVTPETNLVRIAEPRRLKAEIEVAATQARDQVVLSDMAQWMDHDRVRLE